MASSVTLFHKIQHIRVNPDLKEVLWAIVEEIEHSREQAVTKTDFSELKDIVRDLAESQRELAGAQQRTEQRVEELAQAQKELTTAQQRTEQRVGELAQAQQRTEQRVEELAQAQQRTEQRVEELAEMQKETSTEVARLAHQVDRLVLQVDRVTQAVEITNSQVGGLGRSMAYALENEAYRHLPAYLAARHQLQVTQRFIRTEIGGKEINFFAHARRSDGEEVVIVGESVLKFDDRNKLRQLEDAVEMVRQSTSRPIIPLIVTHYARPSLLTKTQAEGILVAQSFEWDGLDQEENSNE